MKIRKEKSVDPFMKLMGYKQKQEDDSEDVYQTLLQTNQGKQSKVNFVKKGSGETVQSHKDECCAEQKQEPVPGKKKK